MLDIVVEGQWETKGLVEMTVYLAASAMRAGLAVAAYYYLVLGTGRRLGGVAVIRLVRGSGVVVSAQTGGLAEDIANLGNFAD